MIAMDCETYLFLPGLPAPKIVCGQFADKGSTRLGPPEDVRDMIRDVAHPGSREPLGFANAPYDLGVCAAMFPETIRAIFMLLERGQIKDTHVRQALLDLGRGTLLQGADGQPLERYSLQNIAEKVLGIFVAKENTPRLFYAHLDGVPFELWTPEQRDYALKDARVTYDVIERQGEGISGDPGLENLKLEIAENRANWALHLMSCWGPRTDPAMVADVVQQVTAAHEAAVKKFTEVGIYRGEGYCRRENTKGEDLPCALAGAHHVGEVQPADLCKAWPGSKIGTRDTDLLKEIVRTAYKGQPPLTAGGDVSTDRDTLLESGDELLMAFGEAGKNEKEFSTYLEVIQRGAQVPINVQYDLIKRTTRTSARNPNLQNLPRGGRSRECFVARPGTVWCSVDMPSLELVTLAQNLLWMFGRSSLADILRAKVDPHVNLASRMMGLTYEEGIKLHKAKDPRMKMMRQAAKPVNYGMGGGMGATKLVVYARQPGNGGVKFCEAAGRKHNEEVYLDEKMGKPVCRGCVQEAGRFRDAWFGMLPEMTEYFERVSMETQDPDNALIDVRGPEGAPILWIRGRRFSEAANLRFQGLAARMMKDALWRVAKACYVDESSPLYECRPTLFCHDEIISELPEAVAHEAAFEQSRLMNAAAAYWCPDIPVDARPALQRRWFKAAEEVYTKEGKLRPWWPKDWNWQPDAERMAADLAL